MELSFWCNALHIPWHAGKRHEEQEQQQRVLHPFINYFSILKTIIL
jgi:hypothetical protein